MKKQFIYFTWSCGRQNNPPHPHPPPKKTMYLSLETEYVTLQGKKDLEDADKLRILRWDYCRFPKVITRILCPFPSCDHRNVWPQEKDTEILTLLALTVKKRVSRSGEKTKKWFSRKEMQPFQYVDFSQWDLCWPCVLQNLKLVHLCCFNFLLQH